VTDFPPDPDTDPTRLKNQPSLTTSSGGIWLLIGGLFAAIALAVLIPMAVLDLPPAGLPLVAVILDVTLYLAIVIVRLTTPPGRLRLGLMAIALLAIAAISLGTVVAVAFAV
jgi:hypothetical protein